MDKKMEKYFNHVNNNKYKVFFDGKDLEHFLVIIPEIFETDELILELLYELEKMAFDLELRSDHRQITDLINDIKIPFFEKNIPLLDYAYDDYDYYLNIMIDAYENLFHTAQKNPDYIEIEDLKAEWEKRDILNLLSTLETKVQSIQDKLFPYKNSINKNLSEATALIASAREAFDKEEFDYNQFIFEIFNGKVQYALLKEISELVFFQIIELNIPKFLQKAINNGIKVDINFLKLTNGIALKKWNDSQYPKFLANFLYSILNDLKTNKILDPWTDSGSLAIQLSKKFKRSYCTCIPENMSETSTLRTVFQDLSIDWKLKKLEIMSKEEFGNFREGLSFYSGEESFNVIIGFVPSKDEIYSFNSVSGPDLEVSDKLAYLELLVYLSDLEEDGIGIFIINSDFFLDKKPSGVFQNLNKFNLYIDSIFELPKYRYKGQSYQDYNLLIIRKNLKPKKIFIGNLNPDNVPIPNLIKNWKNRSEGKIAELGTLIKFKSFYTTKSLFYADKARRIALKQNFNSYKLLDIAKSIHTENNLSNFHEQLNSIYLPLFGYHKVSTSIEEIEKQQKDLIANITRINFPIKQKISSKINKIDYTLISDILPEDEFKNPQAKLVFDRLKKDNLNFLEELNLITLKNELVFEYAQIVLDPAIAIAEYTADLLNSDLGITIRQTLMPKHPYWLIKKDMLNNAVLYLPDLDSQKKIVELQRVIKDLSQELFSFNEDLIKWPKKHEIINNKVKLLTVGKRFDHWIESLPFPLSSILFACSADSNVEHKVRYLIHFFEALSEFNATIMLSAISKDRSLFKNQFLNCIKTSKYPEWYYKPTFGNWNYLGTCLSKKLRSILNDKSNLEPCLQMFGSPNRKFLEMLSNKEMYNILKQAALYRNKWLGHGPPVNIDENKARLNLITDLLSQTKQIISYNFNETYIIQPVPGTMSFDGGIFTSTVKVLKGRIPFNDLKVQTIYPLNEKMLYLIHENQYDALELLPFFKMMESPKREQNACYFYNSLDNQNVGKEIQLVSYHFDKEAVISRPYNEFKNLISLFE